MRVDAEIRNVRPGAKCAAGRTAALVTKSPATATVAKAPRRAPENCVLNTGTELQIVVSTLSIVYALAARNVRLPHLRSGSRLSQVSGPHRRYSEIRNVVRDSSVSSCF